MPTVRIWWDTSIQAYRMSSPYNKDLVEALHAKIPYSDRSFDKQTKIWTVTERYIDAVIAFFKSIGAAPTVITRAQAESAQTSSSSPALRTKPVADAALEFLKVLPYEAAQKAYRHAALLLHPDRGGDINKMAVLNAVWERLTKEVYNQ